MVQEKFESLLSDFQLLNEVNAELRTQYNKYRQEMETKVNCSLATSSLSCLYLCLCVIIVIHYRLTLQLTPISPSTMLKHQTTAPD